METRSRPLQVVVRHILRQAEYDLKLTRRMTPADLREWAAGTDPPPFCRPLSLEDAQWLLENPSAALEMA